MVTIHAAPSCSAAAAVAGDPHRRSWPRWRSGLAALLLAVAPASPAAAVGPPRLQEVLYDGPGTDADDVFTEILAAPGTVLTGWKLVGINGDSGAPYRTVQLTGAVVPADGLLVVATAAAAGQALAQRDFTADVDWQNGPDAVQLVDPDGRVADALQYGDAGPNNAGEGRPAPTVAAGQSLSRDAAGTDTGDNLADFTIQATPSPGSPGETAVPPGDTELSVSLPDTTALPGSSLRLPVRLGGLSGRGVLAVELFVSFDSRVLSVDSVGTRGGLLTPGWALVTHVVEGSQTPIDTVKAAMAASADTLAGSGELLSLQVTVARLAAPAAVRLGVEHARFNRASGPDRVADGGVRLIGHTGWLQASPGRVRLPGVVQVRVGDADADRDTTKCDTLSLTVLAPGDTETVALAESGIHSGIFSALLALEAAAPVPGDGRVQTAPGQLVTCVYLDSLDEEGQTRRLAGTVQTGAGFDGRIGATTVIQPGDSIRVQVVDPDPNRDPASTDSLTVTVTSRATGAVALLVLRERSANDSVFTGLLPTAGPDGPASQALAVAAVDSLWLSYADAETGPGPPASRGDTTWVVGLLGDVDNDGLTQTYDASRVLTHVVAPFLCGRDSLAANLDLQAPAGPITATDASLILQYRVGLIRRFPLQEPGSANQPDAAPGQAAKPLAATVPLALAWDQARFALRTTDRAGILAGEVEIEGVEGSVELGDGMGDFLVAWVSAEGRVRAALAGPLPVAGPGDLLRIRPTRITGPVRLGRTRLNDGQLVAAALAPGGAVPHAFALSASFPNPFNPGCLIPFSLAADGQIRLEVLNLLGQPVRSLVAGWRPAGDHQARWDGRDEDGRAAASGVYVCRLQAGELTQARAMVLAR